MYSRQEHASSCTLGDGCILRELDLGLSRLMVQA